MTLPCHMSKGTLSSTHWGTYRVESQNGVPSALHSFEDEPNPPLIGDAILDTVPTKNSVLTDTLDNSFIRPVTFPT